MAWACPFRKETALKEMVHIALLHLYRLLREEEVYKWEETTECIPYACIREHIARADLAVMRAIVYNLSVSIYFRDIAREEKASVKTRVECTHIVDIAILYLETSENVIPTVTTRLSDLIERTSAKLLKVQISLVETDERRSDSQMDLLSPLGLEAHQGTCVIRRNLFFIRNGTVIDTLHILECSIGLDYKPVAEILGKTAGVTGSIAHYGLSVRKNLYI
jgi:hypothetical protein